MKKLLILLTLTTIIAALFITPVIAADETSSIMNPGFEESDNPGGLPLYWDKYDYQNDNKSNPVTTFGTDTTVFSEGKQSAFISSTGTNDARYVQVVPVDKNSYYKISCMIRTENVGEDSNAKGANISVKEIFETSRDIKGSNGAFEEVTLYGMTGPDQEQMTITAGIGGFGSENSGKAWFDNMKLEKLTAKPDGQTVVNFFKPADPTQGKSEGNAVFAWVLTILIIAVSAFIAAIFLVGRKSKNEPVKEISKATELLKGKKSGIVKSQIELPERKIQKLKLGKRDFIIMGILTVVAAVIYYFNLGSFTAPQKFWQPAKVGEFVTFDLGKQYDVNKLMIFGGVNERYPGDDSKYRIEYQKPDGSYALVTSFAKAYTATLTWNKVDVNKTTSRIKISVEKPSGTLNEIAFYAKGSTDPIKDVKIIDQTKDLSPSDNGTPANLIDEQDTIPKEYTFLTGSYFDEIYHPRTAYEFLHHLSPYEITHPPLGKDIMTIGLMIFGAVPFGWRCMGVLFGIMNIPLMYLFGKKLFKKVFYATACGILMMFDFMNFTQSRIGLIDVYAVFFVLLMYFFMYDYFVNRSYTLGYKKSLKPLLFCGIFLGLGAASKWIGVYAAAGLAFLFFAAKYTEYREYNMIRSNRKIKKPAWFKDFIPVYIWQTLAMCIVFFVVIPGIIYCLSYIPYAIGEAKNGTDMWTVIWSNQKYMLAYHEGVNQPHPFQSSWWQWPFIVKPMWYYNGSDLPAGMSSTISAMGNPAIWWTGTFTFILGAVTAIYKKHRYMLVVYVAAICQYFVWIAITRTVFIYHFYSTVPFFIFTIVYMMKNLIEMYNDPLRPVKIGKFTLMISRKRIIIWLCAFYLAVVVGLFILFYPAISGFEVSTKWINLLKWFPGWPY